MDRRRPSRRPGDGRPTGRLSLRELFDLNAYWLAINILGARSASASCRS